MRLLLHLTSLALAACASAPTPRPPLELAPFLVLRESHFPGARAVLAGFAAPDDDPSMRVGDAALLGLEVHRGEAIERQLVLLEVESIPWEPARDVVINGVPRPDGGGLLVRRSQSFTVTATKTRPAGDPAVEPEVEERTHYVYPVQMRLQRLDGAGQPLRTSVATMFEEPLATGFWPYTQAGASTHDSDMAFALTMSLQELAARDAVLQELLFRVVDEPSLWSVATHLGVSVLLRWDADLHPPRTVAIDHAPELGDEVRSSMFELRVNGDCASWVTLLAGKPRGAMRVCGGLIGAIAQHPNQPDRLAVLRLLATRRGASPVTR